MKKEKLIKKSYWVYPAQAKKIKKLSKKSESEALRQIIDQLK